MKKVNLLLLALLGLFLGACDSNDDTDGDWGKAAEFSGNNRVCAVSFTDKEGNVYIGMGYNEEVKTADKNLTDFWKFDGSNWEPLTGGNFPDELGGRYGSVAFVIGDTAYIGAGFRSSYTGDTEDRYFSDFYAYDLVKQEWIKNADGEAWTTDIKNPDSWGENTTVDPVQCAFHSGIAFSYGGKGYVGTGQIDGRASNMIYCFDPQTGKWTNAKFEGDSRVGASVFEIDGKIILCLGASGTDYRRDVWMFDGKWNRKRSLADVYGKKSDDYDEIPRQYAASFVAYDGNLLRGYIAGGTGARNTRSCWEYRIENDRWYEVTEFPVVMGNCVAGVGFSSKDKRYGYITVGGSSRLSATRSATWQFIPGVEEDDENDY